MSSRPAAPVHELSGDASTTVESGREPVANRVHGLARRRQDPEGGQGPAVHDKVAVDKNFVFAVPPMFGIDLNLELLSQFRRHPDGVEPGNSIRTIAN